MPDYDLDHLVTLLAAATGGEWLHTPNGGLLHRSTEEWEHLIEPEDGAFYNTNDSCFIAATHSALPAILADLRDKDAKIEKLKTLVQDAYLEGWGRGKPYINLSDAGDGWDESDVRKSLNTLLQRTGRG